MGVAVNGMHFTGMSAMSVFHEDGIGQPPGATASTLLIPIGLAVIFGVLGLVYALMAAPTEEDRAGLAYLEARERETPPAAGGNLLGDALAASQPRPDPLQPAPRRMPTSGSSWTFRDRAQK